MRKVIAAINMTLDGFCDHTAVDPDDEIHEHYSRLLNEGGTLLYGRITYLLMESYWPAVVKNPTGDIAIDEFAVAIDNIPKIVYSRTLENVVWKSTLLKRELIQDEITELRQQPGKDILVGSPGLIVTFLNLGLIDELQLCVHPVIVGTGKPLFKNISDRMTLRLLKTKTFSCGAEILYYEPERKSLKLIT